MNFRKIKQELRKDIKITERQINILSDRILIEKSELIEAGLPLYETQSVLIKQICVKGLTGLNIELIAVKIMQARAIKERLFDKGCFGYRINLCDQYILNRGMELRNYLENNN